MITAAEHEKVNRREPLILLGGPHSGPTWQYGDVASTVVATSPASWPYSMTSFGQPLEIRWSRE